MNPLLYLDVETTGLTPQDRLCQVAYRSTEEDEIHSQYFLPPIPVCLDAMMVNHITNKFLADKEPFQSSIMFARLASLLQTHTLVAHNAKFDIDMLEREGLKVPRYICTKKVAKHLDLAEKNNLQYLRYALELDVPTATAHTAEGDVAVLIVLYNRLEESITPEEMVKISMV
jgi:DNA polymerase III epsilon subunit-like protein